MDPLLQSAVALLLSAIILSPISLMRIDLLLLFVLLPPLLDSHSIARSEARSNRFHAVKHAVTFQHWNA